MEGLLARLQHASLGKKELFDLLMSIDLNTLETAQVPIPKEQTIYSADATLVETIVIHPMSSPKEAVAEPKEAFAEPKEAVAEPKEAFAQPKEETETIEQIIFYPEGGSDLPTILFPPASAPLPDIPTLNTVPTTPELPSEPEPEPTPAPVPTNIMQSLFNLKKAPTEEKAGPLFTCQACQRVFKRQHLLSQHHEISLSCSQSLARDAASSGNKGIHQLVHDCLNRASRGEEEDKNECVYCHAPFTTKESQRAHFQASSSCNRLAIDAFKHMILAL